MTKKAPTKEKQLEVEYVDINLLIPYINNAKLHPPEQVAQIAASIKEFGFTSPILIDETNTILAGHGRLEGALKLGLSIVPIIRLDYLSPSQKKAYIIADNKIAMNTGFDNQMLKIELESLKEMDFNLDLTGFTIDEMTDLQIPEFQTQETKVVTNTSKELDENDFSEFDCKCPRCGFEFDKKE